MLVPHERLTHGPPSNVFDKTLSNDNAGYVDWNAFFQALIA